MQMLNMNETQSDYEKNQTCMMISQTMLFN